MPTLSPERTDDPVVDLRRGFDLDDLTNPAGTLFSDSYREHEITMTGDLSTQTNFSNWDWDCPAVHCCIG